MLWTILNKPTLEFGHNYMPAGCVYTSVNEIFTLLYKGETLGILRETQIAPAVEQGQGKTYIVNLHSMHPLFSVTAFDKLRDAGCTFAIFGPVEVAHIISTTEKMDTLNFMSRHIDEYLGKGSFKEAIRICDQAKIIRNAFTSRNYEKLEWTHIHFDDYRSTYNKYVDQITSTSLPLECFMSCHISSFRMLLESIYDDNEEFMSFAHLSSHDEDGVLSFGDVLIVAAHLGAYEIVSYICQWCEPSDSDIKDAIAAADDNISMLTLLE